MHQGAFALQPFTTFVVLDNNALSSAMKSLLLACLFLCTCSLAPAQSALSVQLNKTYSQIAITGSQPLHASLKLQKGDLYQIKVQQEGIDVVVKLTDPKGQLLEEKDSPNGSWGLEQIDFEPNTTGTYSLSVYRLEESGNKEQGKVSLKVRQFTPAERKELASIAVAMAPENAKNVLTIDIDHFWEAYDALAQCKTYEDSVLCIEKKYLLRGTDGLKDFAVARDFTPEGFINALRRYPKYYASVRPNTYEVKKAEPIIEEVFQNFKKLYPNFKPFKVCFGIGMLNTGGTVSNQFVLIGTEISTAGKNVDYSEFDNGMGEAIQSGIVPDVSQKIKNFVAHECVHTQQKSTLDTNGIACFLLYSCIREGACDFIGELITGSHINKGMKKYADAHEAELWQEFKNMICQEDRSAWLYNGGSVKDKPADLGYYIGYKICEAYYQNATDKKQAIVDIIEMDNPMDFLIKSGYDRKPKQRSR